MVVEVATVKTVEAVDGDGAGVDVPVTGAGVGNLPVRVSLRPRPLSPPSLGLAKHSLRLNHRERRNFRKW